MERNKNGINLVRCDGHLFQHPSFEPLKVDYIKIAHDRGLETGDIDQIEIVGMDKKNLKR